MTIALIGFAAVLILAFMRMPLGIALGLVGLVGFSELSNYRAGMSNAARLVIDSGQSYGLSVVPLFILMGLMVDRGGMCKRVVPRRLCLSWAPQRRSCNVHHRGLRHVLCNLRIITGNSGDNVQSFHAGNAPLQI